MRRISILLITIGLLVLCVKNLSATPVDSTRAKQLALSFFSSLSNTSSEHLSLEGVSIAYCAYAETPTGEQTSMVCFYVVNVGSKGFVMLSGDDRVKPVLGYSYESSFKAKDIPENLKGWLDGKRKEIAYALAMADFVVVPEITEQWNHLSEIGAALSVEVQPLLQTTWDQNAYYNQYCPADPNGPNGHAYAGCVATAMAQIVRYWEWPWSGFDSHSYSCDYGTLSVDFSSASYNYNNMPNSINGNSSTIQRDAVATLTYHCGVCVDMDYSSDGSGAASYDVMAALVHYFAYPSEMSYRSKSNYTSVEWNNLLRNELNNSRPVLYSGQGTGGHAFVCDGYDNNGSYHFNWGWSGYFNGYYALNALIPSSGSYSPGYNFTDDQEAIFGISAVGAFLRCSQNSLNVSAPIGGSSSVKTVDVRGHSLSGNITVTAGNGFMVGIDGSTFSNSVTMPAQGGRLYLRYTPTLSSAGSQNANVILASGTVRDSVFCLGTAIESVCLPPQNLTGTHTGSQVNLSWNSPITYGSGSPMSATLSWDSTVYMSNSYGLPGYEMTYCMVQRFENSDLTPYHHYQLTKVSFFVEYNANDVFYADAYRVVVYKGGGYDGSTFNPGEQVANQVVPMSSVHYGWNTIALETPVMVDASQELWFGVVAYTSENNPNPFVICVSTNGAVPNKGNILGLIDGEDDGTGNFFWEAWSATNNNFPMKGVVEQLPINGIQYDIYRQLALIGSTTSTSYTDGSPLSHDCEYTVSAVWDGECSQSASVTVEAPSVPSISYGDTTAIACESFDWYEHTNINVSGEYTHTFVGGSASGGDSVVTLHLTVHHPDVVMIDSTVCESELPITWNSKIFTETGTQTVTLTNTVGCDSIVTMHLTVNNLVTELLEDTACNSYTWNDSTYYESGKYVQHFQTSYGCDSVVTLHLTLYYDTFTDWTDTAYETYTWNDSIYVVSGDYVQHFETVHGCDSVVTFHLILYYYAFTDWTDTTCDTYTWNDSTYVVSGDYVQRFETLHGRDSIVTLHLYLHYSVTTELDSTVCTTSLPLIWNGITFTEPGTQTVTLDNIYGCDSVVVMTLNVSDYCGPVIDEKSCPGHETVTDYDGNVYATVQIGGQCWMRENLKTTHYADGTTIDTVYSITEPCRFAPGSDISNVSTYGYLYNWYAVMKSESSSDATPSNVQGICPYGWHVPSDAEWIQLTDYISSQSQFQCDDANTYIAKALAATTEWQNSDILCTPGSNQGQNNTSGFNVLPAGFSLLGGGVNFGYEAYLWSATSNVSYSNSFAYNRHLNHSNSGVSRDAHDMSFAFSVRCLRDEGQSLYFPAVTTNSVSVLTTTTATGGGTVTALNGVEVMECGVCWSINHNPTVADAITTDANCTGSFTSSLTGLSSNFVYYVRAYATNQYGTVYGEEVSFMTPVNINGDELSCPGTPILTDFDGNVYNTVQIGEQCWMRENLRTTKYADGVAITKGNGNSNTIGYWFYPNNDTANKQTYGLLYNWSAVMYGSSSSNNNPSGVQGICPDGWHVPSNTEWIELQNYVGTQSQYRCNNNFSYITKALASTTGWENSSTNCAVGNLPSLNNSTGFGAVPAGYCGYDSYPNFATIAFFWIATETSSEGACNRDISYANAHLYQTGAYKYCGHSVRCLRDSVSCGDTVPPLFHGTLPDGHVCPENGRYYVPDFTTYFTDETVSDNSYPFSSLTVSQNPAAGTEIDTETEVTITLSDPCGNGSLYYVDVIPTYSPDTFMAFSVCENELPVSFEFDGITFSFAEEGTQTVVLSNVWECSRTVTVNLIVIQTTTVEVDTVVCADSLPIFWNGVNFTEDRTYYDTLTTVNGCDSVVVMMLNVSDCRPLEYGQHFPYDVSVETVSGHCYDDGHLIINLLDNNGNVIQIDPQTHNAVNTVQYPLYNVRYHYQNISDGGLQYDYNHDIILMAGTYCVGVTAKIPSPNGGYMQVDTTFCNVQVTTIYDHLEATALSNVAYDNDGDVERYGFRASFHCADVGRIQLRIVQGPFPYTVTILDEQQDTVRHTVFYHRANSGNNPYAASYRDYYTFDSLPIGTYSIYVSDSCGYTVPLTFSIPDYEPIRYLALVESELFGCLNETVVPFRVERRYPSWGNAEWCNYNYSYLDSILMYRFINPGGDTTEWKNINTPGYAATWVLVNDTFPSYCDIFYDTIKMQLHDLCHDTLMTYSFRFLPQFGFSDSIEVVYQQDTIIHDTCATHLPNGVSTQSYKIWGSTWTGGGKTIYGSAYSAYPVPFRYYRCPLSYNIWSLPDSTLLGHSESDEFTGLGTWETYFADTSLHVYVSVTDAQGCTLADKDTVLVYQTEPVDESLYWYECHNDKDDDGKDHCCADRYLWIQEHGVDANTFRRNITLRLIESPLYNQFNFTAIRQDGVWTTTPDDPNNHSTYVEFSYEDGWRATVRDSVCLPPGRYTFEVSTDCGVDTITYSWAGYYYDTLEFTSAPQYEMEQFCDHIVVTQTSTGLVNYMYFIDPEVSNDIPEETIPNYACTSYSPQCGFNYRDSQGRNVLVFSIPGTYVITNYAYNWPYSNCTDWCSEYHYYYDTITVAFSYVDLDMASALLCDQSSPTGIVSAKAVNGNAPYTYTLYDQWNATGNVVATNSTGFFDNVPMTVGQHFSVQVTDSCQTSFSVNLTATVLSHGSLVWDEVASSRPHCAGDTVQLTAMNFPPPATYHWTGPNGFSSTSPTVDVVLPDYSENGWYTVEVLNSNICGTSLVDSVLVPMAPNPQVNITGDSTVCSGGSATLQATSSVAESSYRWNTGDTTNSITVSEAGFYRVTATPVSGCSAQATFKISSVKVNGISNINIPDICAGDTAAIILGYDVFSNHTVDNHGTILALNDTIFLPDGVYCTPYGCSYQSALTFAGYEDTAHVNSVDDIRYVRINMEHSFSGDLYINITCPNGQKADILRFGGYANSNCGSSIPQGSRSWQNGVNASSGTDFGLSNSNSSFSSACNPSFSSNAPGTGWNYCWSNNTIEGYTYAPGDGSLIYRSVNAHDDRFDSSNVVAGTQFYHPDQSFASLIGCPLNGSWYIEVMDGSSIDNGYIFGWELALAEDIQTVKYADVVNTTVYGPWVTATSDSSFLFTPPESLSGDTVVGYTFIFTNEYGCVIDTTSYINIYARKHIDLYDTVCANELPLTWNGATFTEAGTQTVTLTNVQGCDSIVTLNLTIAYEVSGDTTGIACGSFDWYEYSNITESGVYTHTFEGGSSFGCDSTVVLHLTVHHSVSELVNATACESYTWNDSTYYVSGDYVQHFQTVYGCDSIVTLRLHIDTTVRVNISDSICYGNLYNSLGFNFTANVDTTVSDTITSIITGCDSIVTLHLTLLHSTDIVLAATVNENDLPYYINDTTAFIEEGEYTVVIPNAVGCDSTIYLNLTVNHNVVADIDSTVCESLLPVVWNDSVFTEAGTKTTTIPASTGADSIVVMTLTVMPTTYDVLDITIVENNLPYILNGDEYSSSGTFTQTLTNRNGCDSILTVNLTVLENVSVSFDTIICGSFVWNGITYTQSGDYTQYFSTVYGSDSVVTLHLTTLATPTVTVTATDTALCVGGTAMLHAEVTSAGADYGYQWYKDNVPIQGAVTADYFASEGARDSAYHYTVTVFSVMGCDVTASAPDITFVFDPIVEVSINHNASCVGGTATLVAEVECGVPLAAFTYNWYRFSANAYSPNSTELVGTTAELSTMGNKPVGIYAYWVTVSAMDQGCSSSSEIVSHTVIPDPVVTITVANGYPTEVCDGGSTAIEANVSGGYGEITYQWYKNGDLMAGDTSQTLALQNLTYGVDDVYTVEVTQTGVGCANSASAALDTLVNVSSSASSFSDTVCDSYIWDGVAYYASGEYVRHFQTFHGCDSIVTLHLTVKHSVTELVEVTACDSYVWNDVTYTESGDYTNYQTTANGCDSIVTLHLTIHHGTHNVQSETLCESYTWHGATYTQSGTYTYDYTTLDGCPGTDTLKLTVNTPTSCTISDTVSEDMLPYILNGSVYNLSGTYTQTLVNTAGCDSILTVNLTVLYNVFTLLDSTVCDVCEWNGISYTQSGDYTQQFISAIGGDSIVTLHLTVLHSVTELVEVTACDSYEWNGLTYTESGDYPLNLISTSGCDSIVTLHLTINHPDTVIFPATACDSYNWNDVTYTESGDYMTYVTNASGCGIVMVLRLTVNHSDTTDLYATACDSYTWNDEIYTESGHYSVHLTNAAGCDSTVTLHLTVNHSVTELVEVTACDSYTWNGVTYTESGDYTNYLTTVDGCDSMVTLHLTINHSVTELVEVTACDSYTWNGETYTESGIYSVNLNTTSGCDSLVTLHLTIHYSDTIDFYATACGSYNWNGEIFVESGDYVNYMTNAAGCDLVTILHLTIYETEVYEFSVTTSDSCYTWNGITYCHTGDYTQTFQAVTGCDSVVTLHLIITVGIDNMDGFDFKVYPNPSGGVVNVQCTKDNGQVETMDIQVFDAYGRYLQTVPVVGEVTQVDLVNYAAGIYFVKAVVGGQIVAVRKVVRE